MDSTQSIHSLKPNLSQLLMRTFEQLEDPKYATVPQTHWDELRPSILSKYHMELGEERASDFKSERKLSKDDDWQHVVCKECWSKTTPTVESSTQKSTSRCSSKPLSFRTFNWKIKPLWRYCASAVHLHYENGTKQVVTTGKAKRNARKAIEAAQISSSCVKDLKFDFNEVQKAKWRSQSFDHLEKSRQTLGIHSQYSMPAFEVLPPLFENCTHSLLYQNSYLLDGVKYDYAATKSQQQSAKLYLNYMKFLKSVNKPVKPTDCDIVFGEAKVVMNPSPHWEGSRIDWLLNLERKQELRKLQTLEQERQLSEKQKAIDLARMEAKLKRKELKNAKIQNNNNQNVNTEPTVKRCEDCQIKKRKGFFLKRFKRSADCKKTPKVELLPTL